MKTTLIVVQNEADYRDAKALVEKLMHSTEPRDAVRLSAQARLIEVYEQDHWPRRAPSPAQLLCYLMEEHGLSRADLASLLGTESRVSEVLAGKRELSMTMIKRLRERFRIPADVLIPPRTSGQSRKRIAA